MSEVSRVFATVAPKGLGLSVSATGGIVEAPGRGSGSAAGACRAGSATAGNGRGGGMAAGLRCAGDGVWPQSGPTEVKTTAMAAANAVCTQLGTCTLPIAAAGSSGAASLAARHVRRRKFDPILFFVTNGHVLCLILGLRMGKPGVFDGSGKIYATGLRCLKII